MKLVEPESAVVDERLVDWGLAGVCRTKLSWYGKVDPWQGWHIGGTGLVRCTPAMSISSMTSEGCNQMIYVTIIGISGGTWELQTCQFRDKLERAEFLQSWTKGPSQLHSECHSKEECRKGFVGLW